MKKVFARECCECCFLFLFSFIIYSFFVFVFLLCYLFFAIVSVEMRSQRNIVFFFYFVVQRREEIVHSVGHYTLCCPVYDSIQLRENIIVISHIKSRSVYDVCDSLFLIFVFTLSDERIFQVLFV